RPPKPEGRGARGTPWNRKAKWPCSSCRAAAPTRRASVEERWQNGNALASKASARKGLGVRVPRAPSPPSRSDGLEGVRVSGRRLRAALPLCRLVPVHQTVGFLEQVGDRAMLGRIVDGRADAEGDEGAAVLPSEQFLERREGAGHVVRGGAAQQHAELVASEPSHDVGVAEAREQALGERAEHAVAFAVAERV